MITSLTCSTYQESMQKGSNWGTKRFLFHTFLSFPHFLFQPQSGQEQQDITLTVASAILGEMGEIQPLETAHLS